MIGPGSNKKLTEPYKKQLLTVAQWVEFTVAKMSGAHRGKNEWRSPWQKWVELTMAKIDGDVVVETVEKWVKRNVERCLPSNSGTETPT